MFDLIKMAKRLVENMREMFVAEGNKGKQLRLRFGRAVAILGYGNRIAFRNRAPVLDGLFPHWTRIDKNMFVYPESESNPHIVIAGMSGFGKSTLFKSILIDIRNFGLSCILFDAHDEHSDTVRGLNGEVHNALYSAINILELDGASVSERISELSRLFKEVYALGYIQATKLSECLWYTYRKAGARSRTDRTLETTPTIRDLLDELSIFIRNSKSIGERNTLLHLKDRLSLLNSSAFAGQLISTSGLDKGLHSFSLGGMKSKEARIIYIGELLNRIYAKMHDSERQVHVRLYIMIDEAQFLVDESGSNSIITKIVEEGRKYGIGVVVVTHAASTLNKKIMANCSTFATFYAREPSEVNYVVRVLSGSNPEVADAVRKKIGTLRGNQAIIITNVARSPTVISTPKFDEMYIGRSGVYSESEIEGLFRSRAGKPIRIAELDSVGRVDGVVVERLLGSGMLDRFVFKEDGNAEEWLMVHNRSISIEHEVYVKKMAELLSSRSIQNRVIDNSNGPDISAVVNGKRVAIEYETGLKSLNSTAGMITSRLDSYDRVIVVTNSSSIDQYSRSFASERIRVVVFAGMIPALMGG